LRGQNCYVVSYDIMEPERLQKVHKMMKGFGDAVHYSVFRCDLTPKGRVEMIAALTGLIKHDEDRVMIINIGPVEGMAEDRIEFLGVHRSEEKENAIIV
jgi:CRISPR-associated protein Cas2